MNSSLNFSLSGKLSMSLDDLIVYEQAAARLQALWRGFCARRNIYDDEHDHCDCAQCRGGYDYVELCDEDNTDWYWNDGSGYCDW